MAARSVAEIGNRLCYYLSMKKELSKPRTAGRIAAGGSLLLGTAGVGMFLAPHAGATGSIFTVLNTNDSGAGSLRQALIDANNNAGADTVVFDAAVSGTITLASQLDVTDSVTVQGPGSANLSISSATKQIFYLYKQGVSNDVSISGLTLTGGALAIHSWSTNLVLDDVVASGSTVDSAIILASNVPSLDQSLTIRNSVITGANVTQNGAGIRVESGFGPHAVSIENTEITNNTTSGNTGGLRVDNASSVVVSNSKISGNTSENSGGGAFFTSNVGDVKIISTTVDGNTTTNGWGGGLYFNNATVEILNSTISNNAAASSGGGGLEFDGGQTVASISNTTITGNSAAGGGGIRMEAMTSLTINQSTITDNTSTYNPDDGGGIQLYSQGTGSMTLTLSGTIVSGNSSVNSANADIDVKDGGATIVDADNSLLGDGTVDSVIALIGSGNVRSNSPGLGVLADNGGPTKTIALLTGSPAIDAGPNPVATFTGNGFDQRGTPWLRVYGTQVDIGAFEWQPDPSPSTTTTTASPTTTASSDPVAPAFTG